MSRKLFVLLMFCSVMLFSACTSNTSTSSKLTPANNQVANTEVVPTSNTDIQTSGKASAAPNVTSNTTQIELILDDSGSMAGLVGGKTKIDVAKESINKIIDELKLKDKLQTALRIYGHQNKECTNSVLEVPMGKIDSEQMKSKISSLQPLGSTPIYYSLSESVKDFNPNLTGDKIVVLVTDGLESCGGDPCAAARALQAGGVINKMQVVGFGLSKTELNTLQCIVDPFKGQVVGASNSTEFLNAMQHIMDQAVSPSNLNVSVVGADGKPLQAKDICVYPQGQTDKEVACAGMYATDFAFTLKPGVYDLMAINGGTASETWVKNIEIKDNQVVKKVISFAEGSLKVSVIGADGQPTQASDICVYPQGQTDKDGACAGMFTTDYEFKLTPGIYDLKVSNYGGTNAIWAKAIEIKPSETVTKQISI